MSNRRLYILVALLCTGLWAVAICLGHSNGQLRLLDRIESALTDLRTLARGVKAPPDLVTIVAIDDGIVKHGGTYPLPRAEIAGIIDAIAQFEPKVIAVDLLLVDKGPADGDAALAKSFTARPTVLAAAAVFPETVQPSADRDEPLARLPTADRFLHPLPAFAERAEVGIANVTTGQTGTPLSVPMLFRTRDKIELSFPLRVASVAIGKPLTIEPDRLLFGDHPIATGSNYALPISYYGPRRTIRTVSAASLVNGQVDRKDIQGRIVVLGATATGAGDFFPTPFDSLMPGVEIISTAITHLVAGDGMVRDRPVRIVDTVMAIGLPLLLVGLLCLAAQRGRPARGHRGGSDVGGGQCGRFRARIWLDAATTIATTAPPVIPFGPCNHASGRRRARALAAQNELLEPDAGSPGMVDPQPRLSAGAGPAECRRRLHRSSGFTRSSETLDPDATRGLLKEFHALVDKEVTRCGGMITSFLGDGAMILFGLPAEAADDATRAAECSIALCVKTERWIKTLPPSIAARIGFKIGAHFGPIVASRLGGRNHQHITATGDTVNVSSRLMEVAARHDVRLAVSDTLRVEAERTGARLKTGSLEGPVDAQIRGRSGSLSVWLWRSEDPSMENGAHPHAAE
jgi:adenylate cyclase